MGDSLLVKSQSIGMETISCGGNYFNGSQAKLSFTGGEISAGTVKNVAMITQGFEQGYYSWWVGKISTSWKNFLNWNGGPLPKSHTDVIILPGQPFNPLVDSIAQCRTMQIKPGASVTIQTGFSLHITH